MHETHSLRERFLVFFKIFVLILIYQFANFGSLCGHYHDWSIPYTWRG
ncbi:MAG: hypothetical protein ACLRPQ_03045 [Streptococcus sp.]